METFIDIYFKDLKDPRVVGRCTYALSEMLLVALLSIICGGNGYQDMADYGAECLDLLRTFYPFKNGTPKRDAFRSLFLIMDPKQFGKCFFAWADSLLGKASDSIAIDGKCLRGSGKKELNMINMVSAWCGENSFILGQIAVTNKSNEITAIPELLELLDLKNKVITIDAMGCQREIADLIIKKECDYVFSLKGNQGTLHQDVIDFFEAHASREYQDSVFYLEEKKEDKKNHGRLETRKYAFTSTLDWGLELHKWPGLNSVGRVESIREINGKETRDIRYFVTSLKDTEFERFTRSVRSHWGIENKAHWILDVSFNEDDCLIRKGNGPKNLSIIRRYAINLIRKNGDSTRSFRRNMFKALHNREFLKQLLLGKF